MVDSCSNIQTGDQFARLLRHNLGRHMNTNRAPLGLHFHASWLKSKKEFKDELLKFIEEQLKRNDVYFVTMQQVCIELALTESKGENISINGYCFLVCRSFNGCRTRPRSAR